MMKLATAEKTGRAAALPVLASLHWSREESVLEAATPVSFGVPLPQGKVAWPGSFSLQSSAGQRLLTQAEVLARWPDGSPRWVLIDAIVPAGTALAGEWLLVVEPEGRDLPRRAIAAQQDGDAIRIVSGQTQITFRSRGSWRATSSSQRDDEEAMGLGTDIAPSVIAELPQLTDRHGRQHAPVVETMRLVAAGPVRATVEVVASFPSADGLRLVVRWSFYAGSNLAAASVTLHNPRPARHQGGLWDLGDRGSVLFRDLSLPVCFTAVEPQSVRYRCEADKRWNEADDFRVKIYQESSGGESWNSRNHVNRTGEVPLRLRGYRCQANGASHEGRRATPAIEVAAAGGRLQASIPEFWQQFPKAIEAEGCRLSLRMFPGEFPDLHELQGGEQKTHRAEIEFELASDASAPARFGGGALPLAERQPRVTAERVLPGLPDWTDADTAILTRLDDLAEEFLSGPRGVDANRERVDEYGWRNFGELYADHEQEHYRGSQPLVSHYNNQFDSICGGLLQYLRTGDERWMEFADQLARHVIDIDIYHTREDRPAYSGGLFWFTDHYLHAATSTHRTYSRSNRPAGGAPYGGGPSSSHNFTTGLLLYHLMTGNPLARRAVISLAEWVIAMDDGGRTLLGVFDEGPTGLATATGDPLFHGPGRAAGNSLNALLDGWLLTGDRKYLNYAETIIRRVIHPRDDIDSLDLLNAEKRWSYTVFLVALDKYLTCKQEAGEADAMYAMARQSLVHYGRWMLAHERPYFDRREELEYPTEAWPAQELRKANVLRLAGQYVEEPVRSRMFERGDALAERAWSDLLALETRCSARAMAIVLTEGVRDAELRGRRVSAPIERTEAAFPARETFVPQRERVKTKLRSATGLLSLLVSAANPSRWSRLRNPW